jgi:hypothetical protein
MNIPVPDYAVCGVDLVLREAPGRSAAQAAAYLADVPDDWPRRPARCASALRSVTSKK